MLKMYSPDVMRGLCQCIFWKKNSLISSEFVLFYKNTMDITHEWQQPVKYSPRLLVFTSIHPQLTWHGKSPLVFPRCRQNSSKLPLSPHHFLGFREQYFLSSSTEWELEIWDGISCNSQHFLNNIKNSKAYQYVIAGNLLPEFSFISSERSIISRIMAHSICHHLQNHFSKKMS